MSLCSYLYDCTRTEKDINISSGSKNNFTNEVSNLNYPENNCSFNLQFVSKTITIISTDTFSKPRINVHFTGL